MATPKQALLRPIEITSANSRLTVGATNYDIPQRVYANIFHLLSELDDTAASARITADWRVKVTTAASTAFTKTGLSDLLGFDGTETGTAKVATYAPAFCWASTYQMATADRWVTDANSEFMGSMSADGNLYGVSMSTRESLTLRWPLETGVNAYPSAAVASYTGAGSVVRYPTKHSNFWSVVTGSRSAYLSASSSLNVSPKGLYFIPTIAGYLGDSPDVTWLSHQWGSGGTDFDVSDANNKDTYVFCAAPDAPKPPSAGLKLLSYYDIDLRLNTAVAPTWDFS